MDIKKIKDGFYYNSIIRLGAYPEVYFLLRKYLRREKGKERIVDVNTDIVIEGFPRSANSYSVGTFESFQKDQLNIAHHLHNPAQILMGLKLNKPVIVLIRNPMDAVISLKALHEQHVLMGKKKRALTLSFKAVLNAYISFYSSIIKKGNENYVVAPFELVINDFSEFILKVNKVFDRDFGLSTTDDENTDRIKKRGYHALPSDKREQIKQELHSEYLNEVKNNLSKLDHKANEIYNDFLKTGK